MRARTSKLKNAPGIPAVILLGLFSSLVHADCEGLAEKLNATLYPAGQGMVKDLSFSHCKVWPFDPGKTIVALAHFQEGSSFSVPPDNTDGLYDLTVLVVKSDSGEVVNRLFQKSAFASDAIRLNGISIDTAPYDLARNLRAFGVTAGFSNSSALNSWEHTQISLYVPQGSGLKQVLGNLVSVKRLHEQVDDCNESATVALRTLAIATTGSHGYADLILREKKTELKGKKEKNECKVTEKTFPKNYTLRFNGESYAVPKELQY
jgi:hypothetical protein